MSRLIPCLVLSSLAVVACYRSRGDEAGTTSITSATPPAAAEPTRIGAAATRLADEVCKRKASCAQSGPGGTSWQWVASSDCVERERPRLQAMLGSWDCSEASAEARLESCLPAIKSASCEPLMANDARLPLCPTTDTCIDRPRSR